MTCEIVTMPGGGKAFVCTSGRRKQPPRCACGSGKPANLLCDWKTPAGPKPTCDKPLCATCTHNPAEGKDLCPTHAFAWKVRQEFKELPAAPSPLNQETRDDGRSSPHHDERAARHSHFTDDRPARD